MYKISKLGLGSSGLVKLKRAELSRIEAQVQFISNKKAHISHAMKLQASMKSVLRFLRNQTQNTSLMVLRSLKTKSAVLKNKTHKTSLFVLDRVKQEGIGCLLV